MKLFLFVAVAAVCTVEARADVSFSITNTAGAPNPSAQTTANSTTRQADRTWDFTTLGGWDTDSAELLDVVVSETFTSVNLLTTFHATFIAFTAPITSAADIFTYVANATGLAPTLGALTTDTKTTTLLPGFGGFDVADLSTGAHGFGNFRTRVDLDSNNGGFTLTSMTITLDFVPEPATFGMIGLGLAGLGLIARRRNRKQNV